MMKVGNNYLKNPLLRYKLDPGEPGLATPTKASMSVAKVALHEATNLRRFKREAIEEGGFVAYSKIYLNMSQQGSYLAATSGKSKALVIVPDNRYNSKEKSEIEKITDKKNEEALSDSGFDENEVDNTINEAQSNLDDLENVSDLDGLIKNLELERMTLESGLKGNMDENDVMSELQLKDIERKIQYLEMKKEMERQKDFLMSLNSSNNITLKLLGLKFNNINDSGSLVNTLA